MFENSKSENLKSLDEIPCYWMLINGPGEGLWCFKTPKITSLIYPVSISIKSPDDIPYFPISIQTWWPGWNALMLRTLEIIFSRSQMNSIFLNFDPDVMACVQCSNLSKVWVMLGISKFWSPLNDTSVILGHFKTLKIRFFKYLAC